mgnify:CR=1 FL=1
MLAELRGKHVLLVQRRCLSVVVDFKEEDREEVFIKFFKKFFSKARLYILQAL